MESIVGRVAPLFQYAGSKAWGPLLSFSRSAILSVLQNITDGRLNVVDVDGKETLCGTQSSDPDALEASIVVHKDLFWVRLLLFADMVSSPYAQVSLTSLTEV